MQRWLEANKRAEADRDWGKHLGPFYADDAEYHWPMGPFAKFVAHGPAEITNLALGYHMEGFEQWCYPYETVVIDELQGEVVALWRQISPYKRADGSVYEVPGQTPTRFRYAGNFQWDLQIDYLDMMSIIATLLEIAIDGHLDPRIAKKIHHLARGTLMPGDEVLPKAPGLGRKFQQGMALARIILMPQ